MVKREKIENLVKEVVDKNNLSSSFIPIIEEFFFRLADQLEWDDEKLNNAFSRYKNVVDIEFVNMDKSDNYEQKEAECVYSHFMEIIFMNLLQR